MCQMLRVLNQVRNHIIGIPLTYNQYPKRRSDLYNQTVILKRQTKLCLKATTVYIFDFTHSYFCPKEI